jgi:hypothetical protein
MSNQPGQNVMVKGAVAAMLGLLGAWLLSLQPANGEAVAAARANILVEQPSGMLKAGMAKTVMTPPVGTQLSGYEVRSSSLAPEAGKALVDAAIELVGQLK